MKYTFSLILFCLIFQNIIAGNLSRKMHLSKFELILKSMVKAKENKLRQLQGTDQSGESGESDQDLPAPTNYTETPSDQPETGDATAENAAVEAKKPIVTRKKTNNKSAKVQFSKFHGFQKPTTKGPGEVKFGVILYFLGKPIAKYVILRLRITYAGGRLRSLQSAQAESARTDCKIKDESLAGKVLSEAEGQNVNYDCVANATLGDASTASYALNTDIPLTLVDDDGNTESLTYDNVNFNGDSSENAGDLEQSAGVTIGEIVTIKKAHFYFEGYFLKVLGTYDSAKLLRNLLISGEEIDMNINDKDNITQSYKCYISATTNGGETELSCNTANKPLSTSEQNMHLSSGNSSDAVVSIETNNPNNDTVYGAATGSNRFYSKSSSGLGGGAIAGIVIACVVVLAAASIAAIMLRKPSPPIDNTTVVNLKSENI